MVGYTTLTVLRGDGALDEPVMPVPVLGRISFRQAGIIMASCVALPLLIHWALSGGPSEAAFEIGFVEITRDALAAAAPIPAGLALGVPRPRLVPMDVAVFMVIRFALRRAPREAARSPSRLAGFAPPDSELGGPVRGYSITAPDPSVPKSLTVTLYRSDGSPLAGRLARTYIDGELVGSVTTDGDGTMGATFVPRRHGTRRLLITVDGEPGPAVDAPLVVGP